MGTSSARPDTLHRFVTGGAAARTDLSSDITTLRAAYDRFQASGSIAVANPGLMDGELPGFVTTQQLDEQFVASVETAFRAADSSDADLVTADTGTIDAGYRTAAQEAGHDPDVLATVVVPATVPEPTLGAVPRTSGFVDDPVCTGSGFLVDDVDDLPMPPWLWALRWRRVYSSGLLAAGAHGRGWSTWADVVLTAVPGRTDRVEWSGPDGQALTVALDPATGRGRAHGLDATVERGPQAPPDEPTGAGLTLRWDVDADDRASQVWAFGPDGRLATIDDPASGRTTFTHRDGRLAGIAHEGGRALTVEWEGDRVRAVRSSDGRVATYSYDDDGDLAMARRPEGDRTLTTDREGRIVRIVDADGVVLAETTFDAQDRVLTQTSPFGRRVHFAYRPGRRTVVTDEDGGPGAEFQHDTDGRLVALTTAAGTRYARTFDERGRVVAETTLGGGRRRVATEPDGATLEVDVDGSEVRRWRDDRGRVVREARDGADVTLGYDGDELFPSRLVTADGAVTTLTWDRGALTSVVDADGVRLDVEVDADGVARTVRDGLGAETRIDPHPSGQPARATYADGTTSVVDRDDAGRILRVIDPVGAAMVVERTLAGRPSAVVDPMGGRTTLRHDATGSVVESVDPLGRSTTYHHDSLERLTAIGAPGGGTWRYEHTVLGRVARLTDPTGAAWAYTYDAEGRVVEHTDPMGRRYGVTYDAAGRTTGYTDPAGGHATVTRDAAGLPVEVTDPSGAAHRTEWAAPGRPTATVDPDGVVQRWEHTPAGRPRRGWVEGGPLVEYHHDRCGRLVEVVTDPAAAALTRRYEYDSRGRLVAEVDPDGRRLEHRLDAAGRLVGLVADGWEWRYERDAAGRVVAVVDPLGSRARFAHDAAGQLVAATDPLGATVRYRYDARGDLVEVVDAFGRSVRRAERDARGRLLGVTDALGRTTRMRLDASGREVGRDLPDGSRLRMELDARGDVSDVWADDRPVAALDRDALGRVTSAHEPGAGRTTDTTYTPAGRIARVADDTGALEWRYDAAGRRTARGDDTGGDEVRWTWDHAGRLVAAAAGDHPLPVTGGDAVVRRHDGRNQLVEVRRPGPDGTTVTTTLERDPAGRVVRATTEGVVTTYAYDAAGQLVAEDGPDGHRRWSYDLAGRRVAEEGHRGSWRWAYDDAGQVVRVDGPDGTTHIEHDACGRRVAEVGPHGERRFRWDALGRLTGLTRDGVDVPVDVAFDGTLRAVGRHRLRWDPTGAVPEVAEVDGEVVSVGPLAAPAGASGAAGPVDWRGSPTPTDAWGEALVGSDGAADDEPGPDEVGIGFLGEVTFDGLVWLRHRTLDPATGLMLSLDPVPGVPGTPVATNGYHYAGNDPLGHLDPAGLAPVSIEQYDAIREAATGPQWGRIAAVGIAVVGTVVIVASAGTLSGPAVIAMSAAFGAASGAAPGVATGIETGHWDWEGIAKGTVIGGVTGAVTAGIPVRFPATTATLPAAVTTGAVTGAGGAALSEGYDMVPGAPGADGSFDWAAVGWGGVTGAGTGALGYRPGAASPDVPPPTGIEVPPPPTGWSTTPAGLHVPPSGPAVPPPPSGWTTTPSGLYVPPGGVVTPAPPSGWTTSPGGLYVPSGAG